MTISFYVLGLKGLMSLQAIPNSQLTWIEKIIIGTDKYVVKDYSKEIEEYCVFNNLKYTYLIEEKVTSSFIFAIGWRRIIKTSKDQKLIVLHDSLLPKYRGFNPLVTALINGDSKIGVTAIFATENYDEGPILSSKSISIQYPIKILKAIEIVGELYKELVGELISQIENKNLKGVIQNEQLASYSLWRDDKDYFIDWNWEAGHIQRHVNAVGYPYQGAKCYLNDKVLIVEDCTVIENINIANRVPGKTIFKEKDVPIVVCGKGLLRLDRVKELNGKLFDFRKKFRYRFE